MCASRKWPVGGLIPTLLIAVLLAFTALPQTANAAFPDRPLRIVVPYPPGGGNDLLARRIGLRLAEVVGRPVVVENKAGAGGQVGSEFVANSAPDGYTMLMASNQLVLGPLLNPVVPELARQLEPVAGVADLQFILVAHPSLAVGSIRELIEYDRKASGKLNYGTPGSGTPQHLAAELLNSATGTHLVHVPYRGSAPAIADLLAGQIQLAFAGISSVAPHIQTGRLKTLGVSGARRSSALPQVPTIAEAGVSGYEASTWFALFVARGTPAEPFTVLGPALQKVMVEPAMVQWLTEQGFDPAFRTAEVMRTIMRTDVDKWGSLIRKAGIKGE